MLAKTEKELTSLINFIDNSIKMLDKYLEDLYRSIQKNVPINNELVLQVILSIQSFYNVFNDDLMLSDFIHFSFHIYLFAGIVKTHPICLIVYQREEEEANPTQLQIGATIYGTRYLAIKETLAN